MGAMGGGWAWIVGGLDDLAWLEERGTAVTHCGSLEIGLQHF